MADARAPWGTDLMGELSVAAATAAAAYLLGCFPTGYLLGRRRGLDIRAVGDRNMGAANVYRELGPREGFAVLAIDAAKGMAAVLIARGLGVAEWGVFLVGWAVVVGHNWPFFLQFRGGRGAATTLGILAVLLPRPMVPLSAMGLATLLLTRSTTWTCLVVMAPLPFVAWAMGAPTGLVVYAALLPCLAGFTHYLRTRGSPAQGRVAHP